MTRRARNFCVALVLLGIALTHFAVLAMLWGA